MTAIEKVGGGEMSIDSPWWFFGAIVVCLVHALYLMNWRAEAQRRLDEWRKYDESSERRHREFMDALTWYQSAKHGWSNKRGRA